MKKTSNKGFTLVELIIVIAILAIIMLIAIPNFSGIQQRMQVRADKSTAAQIGKAVRIWLTEYNSDPAFKTAVGTTLGTSTINASTGVSSDITEGFIAKTGEVMPELKAVKNINGYVDNTLVPTSLKFSTGVTDPAQRYFIGLTGSGSYEKVVVCIANAAPTVGANNADGTSKVNPKSPAYDGEQIEASEAEAIFLETLAYVES